MKTQAELEKEIERIRSEIKNCRKICKSNIEGNGTLEQMESIATLKAKLTQTIEMKKKIVEMIDNFDWFVGQDVNWENTLKRLKNQVEKL